VSDVVGLDLSLTGTGVAASSGVATFKPAARITPSKKNPITDHIRMRWVRERVLNFVEENSPRMVVVEGLAFNSRTGKATERAGLWWLINMPLWEAEIPVAVVAPTTRAMYGTGRGNADKETVFAETLRRFGGIFDIKNNNEADAVLLYAMGMERLGAPLVDLPATHTRAMGSVNWPK
jgi:crossover junction endodeoxyribonuclease RuvC